MSVAAVILAGGSGSRLGAEVNKVFLPVKGVPILARSVLTALTLPDLSRLVVVTRPAEREQVAQLLAPYLADREIWLVAGGAERHDSEWGALSALAQEIDSGGVEIVAIHDGARPLASQALWSAVSTAAKTHGGAIPTVEVTDLITSDGTRVDQRVAGVQTPQAFRAQPLLAAHRAAAAAGVKTTDTAACLEQFAKPAIRIAAVPSDSGNLKVTWSQDLGRVAGLLQA